MEHPKCLCHIDANVDNFLFFKDGSVKLLDWGMPACAIRDGCVHVRHLFLLQ